MTKLSIITPTYNALDIFKKCVLSVSALMAIDFEWIIGDNGTDGTSEYIKSLKDPRLKLLKMTNEGNYSSMNNLLALQATGTYLCFLNNDVEALSDFLKEMSSILDNDPQAGVVGCTMYYPNTKLQHAGVLISKNLIPINIAHTIKVHPKTTHYSREYQSVTGACLMCKKEDFDKVSGFTEEYNWAYEDVDLCLKIKYNLNKKVVQCASAVAFHHESTSKANPNIPVNLALFRKTWSGKIVEDSELYTTETYNLYHNYDLSDDLMKYRKFEIPRDDLTYLNEKFLEEKEIIILLKKFIIKLRRKPNRKDFELFSNLVRFGLEYYIKILETREIISLVDCYADLGDDTEKGLALSLSCFINQEKIFQTSKNIYDWNIKNKIEEDKIIYRQGSIHSIRLSCDDAIVNFIKRMSDTLKGHNVLYSFWKKILRTHLTDLESSLMTALCNAKFEMRLATLKEIYKIWRGEPLDLKEIQKESFNYKR